MAAHVLLAYKIRIRSIRFIIWIKEEPLSVVIFILDLILDLASHNWPSWSFVICKIVQWNHILYFFENTSRNKCCSSTPTIR